MPPVVERHEGLCQDALIDDAIDIAQAHARDDSGLGRLQHFRDSGHVCLLFKSSDISEYIIEGLKLQVLTWCHSPRCSISWSVVSASGSRSASHTPDLQS